jgi:hypothetical protein
MRLQMRDKIESASKHGAPTESQKEQATVTTSPKHAAKQSPETLEQRFRRLAATWQEAVAYQSSTTVRNNHPAYREIIALGPPVVPLLLRDLEENQTHWFCALREITGANPIPESAASNVSAMVAAWLRWARDNICQ